MFRSVRAVLAAFVVLATPLHASAAVPPHPLDPLSQGEILTTVETLRADRRCPKDAFFATVVRREPPKKEVLAYKSGDTKFRREALVIVFDRPKNATYEAVVDLRKRKVVAWTPQRGAQPAILMEEYDSTPKLVKADARWQEAMARRGIQDLESVWVDVWAAGSFLPEGRESSRLVRAISYLKEGGINFYSRPIEGVTALVDLNRQEVVDVLDTGVVPVAPVAELDEKALGRREDLQPLRIAQPAGTSFKVSGSEVRWQKWRFRFAMQPREALTLYDVSYDDGNGPRSILYRAAIAEMVVPYFDPDEHWRWRNAFDEGEYGLGRLASPLEANRDAPPNAVFFPADFSDDFGKPYAMQNAVGLYERDGGILWKHYDMNSGKNQTRRARELVLFFVATIGNYDYAVQWIFGQDGSLSFDAALTGIMLAKGVGDAVPQAADAVSAAPHEHDGASTGHRVARNIEAPHHQHFFNVRLDFDVDGPANSVLETSVTPVRTGQGLPLNQIAMEERVLATEGEAQRDLDLASNRRWRIIHPDRRNALGGTTGFALVPGENTVPYVDPQSPVRERARFIDHHVWVTRYKDDELYAAGNYPNQGHIGDGLPQYVSDDESLQNEDIVVWYTLGVTHLPRPEEWPVMPAHHVGFKLLPAGFFERNPGLDVPR